MTKEAVEQAECNRWHSEEIHGRNRFPMVSKEGQPALGPVRISRRSFHPTGDGSLGKFKTEHAEFPMDPRRSPRGVLNDHAEDHRTTVSGVTMIRASFQVDQNCLAITQNSLSNKSSRGVGCRRFRTVSRCRSARFSNTRFPRPRKRRTSTPNQKQEQAVHEPGL